MGLTAAAVQGPGSGSKLDARMLVQLPAGIYNLAGSILRKAKVHIWKDTLSLPVYIGLLSSFILVCHIIVSRRPVKHLWRRLCRHNITDDEVEVLSSSLQPPPAREATFSAEIQERVKKHGGSIIFGFKLARLAGCTVFLALSIYSTILDEEARLGSANPLGKKKRKKKYGLTQKEWQDFAICLTSLYAVLLSLVTVGNKRRWSKTAARHLNVLLLVFVGVYGYRDVFPFITFDRQPVDASEGWLLWAKIGVLVLVGLVIPLTIPRQYVPVDPKDPADTGSPEQTASIFSLFTYSFMTPLVLLANRVPHLTSDQLPPLSDYDSAKNLKSTSFPYLDTFVNPRKRHIFWGLLRVFRTEYTVLGLMLTIHSIAGFASPFAIKKLLQFIETGGENATVRPWFWVAWLFFGPIIASSSIQWYTYITTRTLVRIEGIITQLVFEHALRIRVKAETQSGSVEAEIGDTSTVNSTHGSDSISEGDTLHSRGVTEATTVASASLAKDDDQESETQSTNGKSISSKKSGGKAGAEKTKEGSSSASNLVGKINNLVTTDLGNITDGRDFMFVLVFIPLQMTLCVAFLYSVLGWSAFVGLGVMIVAFPLPGYIAGRIQKVQAIRLKKTDARVQTVSETMNVIRMVKMFGWERKMAEKIGEKRDEELEYIWKRGVLDLINVMLNYLIPLATIVASYATFSMTVFDIMKEQLVSGFWFTSNAINAKVSLDRVDDFLRNTELLDGLSEKEETSAILDPSTPAKSDEIGFHAASFAWSKDADGSLTPSKRKFVLRIEDDLVFTPKEINIIVGPTGSGKTSLLMALLGEMHYIPLFPDSWFNLPRSNGIAYAAQESWVQNETIKKNILFGNPYDEERYNKVVYQCGLTRDLSMFVAGDETEVGEKGLTLSGGQKARITLARAIYSPAQTLLLDDVLAALDVHTAKWVVDECLCGDLVKGRTVVLVTHNVALAGPIAKFVVSMGSDGRILSQGPGLEAIKLDKRLAKELKAEEKVLEKAKSASTTEDLDSKEDTKKPVVGQLIADEEVEEGHVTWSALKMFFAGLGGKHPLIFFAVFYVGLGLVEVMMALQTWYLGYWASQYAIHLPSEVPALKYLQVYALSLGVATIIYGLSNLVYVYGTIRAARTLHQNLIESVMGATLRWLDITPISRVLTRCTQDIRTIDGPIGFGFLVLSQMTLSMLAKIGSVVILTPVFIIPGILLAVLGGACGQIYIAAQLSVKREMSVSKAPVLGHFGAAIAGLTSLRAYGAQETFITESLNRVNRYTRVARTFYNLNRWVCIRIDAMGGLFAAGLAGYLLSYRSHGASNTGFSLNMAVGFSSMILWWIRWFNDFEIDGNSLERIEKYLHIEQEPKPTSDREPPAYWPASGNLKVEGLSAKYSIDGPDVLQNVSFEVKAGERVGIVGRTGSGKSSLTLALLRCILTEGRAVYDGIDTQTINTDALRSNITIIPQIPELLSGSLRQNIDPFDQYDDATLNDALRSAGLFSLQQDVDDEGRLNLDSQIASGGGNLSVGQRQILALARAIVRGSKLLILDEATSAIDHYTDSIIQSSLRHELGTDVTVITVAHRLQTIMDADKILVLDGGRVVEFDKPSELLKNPEGRLRGMVDESGDREHLFGMAGAPL